MPQVGPVEMIVAATDDGDWWWVRRGPGACVTATDAIHCLRTSNIGLDEISVRGWTVEPKHMRPFAEGDCPAARHDRDEHGDLVDDDCVCVGYLEEGWHLECPADHPDAVPVWAVDVTG